MSDMPGYRAAQAAYDAMTPPDDGPSECPECGGRGIYNDEDGESCKTCCGSGYINDDGSPFNPRAKEDAEEARAEHMRDLERDERATGSTDDYDE